MLSHGQIVYDRQIERVLSDATFLEQHALELPLSYSRLYSLLKDKANKCRR